MKRRGFNSFKLFKQVAEQKYFQFTPTYTAEHKLRMNHFFMPSQRFQRIELLITMFTHIVPLLFNRSMQCKMQLKCNLISEKFIAQFTSNATTRTMSVFNVSGNLIGSLKLFLTLRTLKRFL